MENSEGKPSIISVRGSKVALGPFTLEHYAQFLSYMQDPDVAIFASNTFDVKLTEPSAANYQNRVKDEVHFTIFELEGLTMIGTTSIRGIDQRNGMAVFGINIGRKEYWGRGYGTEATKLTLDYAFRFLNLHNVLLRTASFNERGQRAYLKAGFKEIGRRRATLLIGGKRYDEVYMDCVADDFDPPVPGWSLPF